MKKNNCYFCNKEILGYYNYCNWNCQINETKKHGGKVITPNNLPISCIKADGSMLEHEHADHPDYLFPIDIEFIGKLPIGSFPEEYNLEKHAAIFIDQSIVVSLYECRYNMWTVDTGQYLHGSLYNKEYKITKNYLDKIQTYLKNKYEQNDERPRQQP